MMRQGLLSEQSLLLYKVKINYSKPLLMSHKIVTDNSDEFSFWKSPIAFHPNKEIRTLGKQTTRRKIRKGKKK